MSAADRANEQLVDRMIAEGALWSQPLIRAFRETPRHRFLDRVFSYDRRRSRWREILTREPSAKELALLYSDRALITHLGRLEGQAVEVPISSSSQPSLMAQMLEDLRLQHGQRVLEIGAGTGYNAALLAHVAGPGQVHSLDVDRSVLSEAWDHLRAFPDRQVHLHHADGRHGFSEAASYDRIMVTAATPDLEPAWFAQLAPAGLLLAPLALAPGLAFTACGAATDGAFAGRLTRAAYFMPLRGEHETGSNGEPEVAAFAGPLASAPAPWAGWFDRRRPRVRWFSFSQALVFFGFLRGLNIHYRSLPRGGTIYGVSEPSGEALCWFGTLDWQVSGSAGRELGMSLWRAFLEAGGPWPTEFRLSAAPSPLPEPSTQVSFVRQGPRCQHVWELIEPRTRPGWL